MRRYLGTVVTGSWVSFYSLEPTRLSSSRALGYAARARHEVAIAIGRSTVAVRFSRHSAAAAFAERFGDMQGTAMPSSIVYAVDLNDEAFFWLSPDRARRWPLAINDELLAFFADNLVMHEYLTTSNDIGLHAAVVASGPVVAALVGSSTAGKTTTAIAAARIGLCVYSDERCILQDGLVVPFLRAITVRDGGRSLLLRDAEPGSPIDARLRALPANRENAIRPKELLGDGAGGPPTKLSGVFAIVDRAATPSVERCSLYDVLPTLLQSMASRDTGLGRAVRLADELRDTQMYRLQLGGPASTATLIERTLREVYAGAKR